MRKFLAAAILLFFALSVHAQTGLLDPAFGNGGVVKTVFENSKIGFSGTPQKIFEQADGTFLVVLEVHGRMLLTRLLANGAMDTAFATKGYSESVSFGGPFIAAMQADGKVLMAGASADVYTGLPADFKVARLNNDGTLDQTFGGGVVLTDFGFASDVPYAIAVQPDGKIIVAGTATEDINRDGTVALVRYNADGTEDDSFGYHGKVITRFNFRALASAMTIDSTGKILVAGTAYTDGSDDNIFLARYTEEGVWDDAFGENENLVIELDHTNEAASGVEVDSYNRIIVAGTSSKTFNSVYTIIRCTDAGVLDSAFNNTGIVRASFDNAYNKVNALLVQKDDNIIIAGSDMGYNPEHGSTTRLAVWRFNPDGQLDMAFNGSGKNMVPVRNSDDSFIKTLALKRNGMLVAAGRAIEYKRHFGELVVAQYTTGGELDAAFGENGIASLPVRTDNTVNRQLFTLPDGKLLVAGNGYTDSVFRAFLIRYNNNGAIDTTFAKKGTLRLKGAGTAAAIVQTDGKIITVENHDPAYNGTYKGLVIARYQTDGTLDTSYGQQGVTTIDQAWTFPPDFRATPMYLQNDNKLVLSYMTSINEPPYTTATTARYNTDGTVDASFGDGGKLPGYSYLLPKYKQKDDKLWILTPSEPQKPDTTLFTRYTSEGHVDLTFGQQGSIFLPSHYNTIEEQANGKFIILSNAGVSPSYKRVLYRLNNNGSLDTSFVAKNMKTEQSAWMAIQDDDKIIIGGIDPEPSGNSSLVIKRYTAEGIIDSTFGVYGTIKIVVEPKKPHHAIQGTIWKNRLYLIGVVSGFDNVGFVAAIQLDEEIGTFKCRADTVVSNNKGLCAATVYGIDPAGNSAVNYKLSGATTGEGTGTASGKSFNQGVTYVTYTLQSDTTQTCTFAVTVRDTEAPSLSNLTLGTAISWPANGNLQDIALNYNALDNCGLARLAITATNDVTGSLLDWELIDNHHIRWHLERLALYAGSTYTITVTATDLSGNESSRSISFTLPKPGRNEEQTQRELQVSARPNPSHNGFNLHIKANAAEGPVTVRVLNSTGIVIETRQVTSGVLSIGSRYKPGIYYIEVEQAGVKTTTKLVKLP
jgi:uncharacterized delta-60 repeat protein